jgi:hypothetical protein
MLSRFFSIFILFMAFFLFQGCSTSESQERFDTVLCWLRPSCLPSQPSKPKNSTPPVKAKTSHPTPEPKQPQQVSAQISPKRPCLTSAQATVKFSKPYVTVSYVEPTTKANGQALTNLAKTTIYHDVGKGLVKHKDIPATNPQGGGTVQEKISFTINKGTSIQATICVTETNANGQEG